EELGELSLRLTQMEGDGAITRYGLGFFNVSAAYGGSTWPITFLHQAGLKPFDDEGRPLFSKPESIDAIDRFVQMVLTGRAHFATGDEFQSGQLSLFPFYVDQ